MNSLQQVFVYQERPVRTFKEKGNIWFIAKDVCNILEISKHRDAVSRLDEDERGSVLVDTLGGPQEVASINEPGLYSLILTSRKPEAKSFKRWITHEVLPSIRKTDTQEQKMIQTQARAQARAERTEERKASGTAAGQAKQLLVWVREEYAQRGDKLALEQDEYLLVRYNLLKIWAGRHKLNLTAILRELHRQGAIEAFSENGKIRYGIRGKRVAGEQVSMVWVKRRALMQVQAAQ